MIKVLLVEDSVDKARRIQEVLEKGGCPTSSVTWVDNVVAASEKIASADFDVVLVDLMVPMRQNQRPNRSGGVRLIREIQKPRLRPRPRYIVGVTAYGELADESTEFFAENLYGLVVIDLSSSAWQKAVRNLIAHAIAADTPRAEQAYDLAVVCALESPELKAVLRLPFSWKPLDNGDDSTEYQIGEFIGKNGRKTVVAASCPQMGMPAAAATTMKMILRFSPRYVAMTGIAAAIGKGIEFGDVVVADPTWDYGSGKLLDKNVGEMKFEQEPLQVRIDPIVKMQFQALSKMSGVLHNIREEWQGNKPRSVLSLRLGPVGSGAAVVAAKSMARKVKDQHRKADALDMETYGVMLAALLAPMPSPSAFVVKGIADFANKKKNDAFQGYASHTSANVLWEWAQRYL